jgi:hypothetical protein
MRFNLETIMNKTLKMVSVGIQDSSHKTRLVNLGLFYDKNQWLESGESVPFTIKYVHPSLGLSMEFYATQAAANLRFIELVELLPNYTPSCSGEIQATVEGNLLAEQEGNDMELFEECRKALSALVDNTTEPLPPFKTLLDRIYYRLGIEPPKSVWKSHGQFCGQCGEQKSAHLGPDLYCPYAGVTV